VKIKTRYEGEREYVEHDGYARVKAKVDFRPDIFFPKLWVRNKNIDNLLEWRSLWLSPPRDELDQFKELQNLWDFLKKARFNRRRLSAVMRRTPGKGWPTIDDYAWDYWKYSSLVWGSCFSKAHLAATLLARLGFPLQNFCIASSHYPSRRTRKPTATHVYLAVRVKGVWRYLDPMVRRKLSYSRFRSVGGLSMVDYEHPYKICVLPERNGKQGLLNSVPLLKK